MRAFVFKKLQLAIALTLASTLVVQAAMTGPAIVKDIAFDAHGQSLEVQITASAPPQFTYFELSSPRRLVVDFHGNENGIAFKEKTVGQGGVERVRASLFTSKDRNATRVVFDLTEGVPYRVVDDGDGHVRVLFREDAPASPRLVVPVKAEVPPVHIAATAPAPLNLTASLPAAMAAAVPESPRLVMPATLSEMAAQAQAPQTSERRATQQAAVATATALVTQASQGPGQTPQFTGEPVTVQFTDMPINKFLQVISEISGLNISIDPDVSGNVPGVYWRDVPWDQMLDIVLRQHRLGPQLQGNVLRIATLATLQAEENAKKAQRDAVDSAIPTVTRDFQLSYTKADAVAGMLTRSLSPKGRITQDVRRNALIIEDVPSKFDTLTQLIKVIDTAAQQVEIESVLLRANKGFQRDLGNQIGFMVGNRNVVTGAGADSPATRPGAPPRSIAQNTVVPLLADYGVAAKSGLSLLLQPGGNLLLDEIITAAESRGTVKILSKPKITTQNNTPATIQSGTQIPVQTNVNNTISVQFIDFSLKLTVTPQITDKGTILANVSVENSAPDFAKSVNGIPSIGTQKATTTVEVSDGGTAVIGGIFIDSDSHNIQQTPGLGSIPILGHLFKSTQTIKNTDELLIFVTPRIRAAESVTVLPTPQQ